MFKGPGYNDCNDYVFCLELGQTQQSLEDKMELNESNIPSPDRAKAIEDLDITIKNWDKYLKSLENMASHLEAEDIIEADHKLKQAFDSLDK